MSQETLEISVYIEEKFDISFDFLSGAITWLSRFYEMLAQERV